MQGHEETPVRYGTTEYWDRERRWLKKYLGQLKGATVVGVRTQVEDDGVWPSLVFEKDGKRFATEIAQDPEGNGPGFLFGLPHVTVD